MERKEKRGRKKSREWNGRKRGEGRLGGKENGRKRGEGRKVNGKNGRKEGKKEK